MLKLKNLILLFILIITSCSDNKNLTLIKGKTYDFEVLYLYQGDKRVIGDKYRNIVSDDSLYIMIEEGFKESHVILEENGEIVYDKIVNSEQSQGLADWLIRDIKKMKNVGLRVDAGPLIFLEMIDVEYNIIGISRSQDKIRVVFYKKVPMYE